MHVKPPPRDGGRERTPAPDKLRSSPDYQSMRHARSSHQVATAGPLSRGSERVQTSRLCVTRANCPRSKAGQIESVARMPRREILPGD